VTDGSELEKDLLELYIGLLPWTSSEKQTDRQTDIVIA